MYLFFVNPLISLLAQAAVFAASFPQHPYFTHLRSEDGLSVNTVYSIAQDGNRNMWFATMDAIDKYDGYHFSTYSLDLPPDDRKRGYVDPKLFSDNDGGIWAFSSGLFRYDSDLDKFRALNIPLTSKAKSMAQIGKDIILVATDSLLFAFDKNAEILTELPANLSMLQVYDFLMEGDDLYIASKTRDLLVYSISERRIKRIEPLQISSVITDIVVEGGKVWLSTDGDGVYCLEKNGNTNHFHAEGVQSICSNRVRTLCSDIDGRIWAGTGNGLSVIDPRSGNVVNIVKDRAFPNGLGNNFIKDIIRDKEGGIWIGTFYGGVDYYYPKVGLFEEISLDNKEEIYGCITEDKDGSIWIGTSRNGAYHYYPEDGRMEHIKIYPGAEEMNDVKSISFSKDGKSVYFGTGLGGLNIYNRDSGGIKHFIGPDYPSMVYSIFVEDDRYIWLGTLSGLYLFDLKTEIAHPVDLSEGSRLFIFCLIKDERNGLFWIGSENSLLSCRLGIKDELPEFSEVTFYPGISLVQDILCCGYNTWIATRNGLFLKQNNDVFKKVEKLPNELVRGIESDNRGNVWAGTDNGLCRISSDGKQVSKYFRRDGTVTDSYSLYAHLLCNDGNMFFGGIGGVMMFDPDEICPERVSMTPVLSAILIDGNQTRIEKEVTLTDKDRTLELRFSVPNYSSTRNNVFHYRLTGFESEWHQDSKDGKVIYTSLKTGRYTFELMSENADGISSHEKLQLGVKVLPPWYFSLNALIIYALIIIVGMFFIIRYVANRVAADKNKEMEISLRDKQDEINRLIVSRYAILPISGEDEHFLLKVLKCVEDNMSDENYKIETMASDLCMTRVNLHIKMKKITGESALRFVQKVKFDQACKMLKETSLSISEVGAAIGIGSPSYFTASFKKHTGILPCDYRKKYFTKD